MFQQHNTMKLTLMLKHLVNKRKNNSLKLLLVIFFTFPFYYFYYYFFLFFSNFISIAALRAEFRRKAEADASPEAIEALNQIGYKNANEAVSQEDYIRVMLLAIALHPPALIALYSFGVFDAIV